MFFNPYFNFSGTLLLKFEESDLNEALKSFRSWLRNAKGRRVQQFMTNGCFINTLLITIFILFQHLFYALFYINFHITRIKYLLYVLFYFNFHVTLVKHLFYVLVYFNFHVNLVKDVDLLDIYFIIFCPTSIFRKCKNKKVW